jgi:murein DD-endopeptidase MepM/ murein hydrolase activator NlpD
MESSIGKVVDFEAGDRLHAFDFTAANKELTPEILADTQLFTDWIEDKLIKDQAKYGIGGYNEHRSIYSRSEHFNDLEEPRRLHLGTDIWGPAGTPVYSFSDATVHSFGVNENYGDYGATIVLQHYLNGDSFYVLYGHLSLSSLFGLQEGLTIAQGVRFAEFGIPEENGHWPPHLHFQVIRDMQGFVADYPGVCQYSKKEEFLSNCPDPAFILNTTFETQAF